MSLMIRSVIACAFVWSLAAVVGAQASVTPADLGRLDEAAGEVREQLAGLRTSDPTLAAEVERSLLELSDEIAYLRVKLRRDEPVSRDEYASLRDRIETLRVRSLGGPVETVPEAPPPAGSGVVPVGAQFDVRLQTALSSATATVEQRFEATTILDYAQGATVVIPAGSVVRGFVSSVRAAGRIDRRGSLTLSFDELRVGTRSYRLRASVTEAIDGQSAEDARRIGTGAVVGAILGGLFGGGKGALFGVLVGAGGTIAATEGADVELPPGTVLRIRIDQALEVAGPA